MATFAPRASIIVEAVVIILRRAAAPRALSSRRQPDALVGRKHLLLLATSAIMRFSAQQGPIRAGQLAIALLRTAAAAVLSLLLEKDVSYMYYN